MLTVAQEAQACRNTFKSVRAFLLGATTPPHDQMYHGLAPLETSLDTLAMFIDFHMEVAAQLHGKDWRSFHPTPSWGGTGNQGFIDPAQDWDTNLKKLNAVATQFLEWVEG